MPISQGFPLLLFSNGAFLHIFDLNFLNRLSKTIFLRPDSILDFLDGLIDLEVVVSVWLFSSDSSEFEFYKEGLD